MATQTSLVAQQVRIRQWAEQIRNCQNRPKGIETISQMGYSKNYWTAFKEYGTMGQYIYVKRKDNKMVLIDKNDLSTGELEELTQLLLNNVKM